jgi:hypothetical protein
MSRNALYRHVCFLLDALNTIKEGANSAVERNNDAKSDFIVQNSCLQLLNHFVDHKDEEKLEKVLSALIEHKVVAVTSVLFGPLMKMKLDQ